MCQIDKKDSKSHSRRQQLGMPDRWRLLEKLDPTVMVFVPKEYTGIKVSGPWKALAFARKSQVEELKKMYGEDLEVL